MSERKTVEWIRDEMLIADDGGESIGYAGLGWYFWDETWSQIHGPYPIRQDAVDARASYDKENHEQR